MTKIPLKKSPLSLMILSIVSGHLYAETAVEPGNVQQLNTIVISAEQNANPQQQYQKELAQVSGGTNFIGEQQLEQQRLATTADVFRFSQEFMPSLQEMKVQKSQSVVQESTGLQVHTHPVRTS